MTGGCWSLSGRPPAQAKGRAEELSATVSALAAQNATLMVRPSKQQTMVAPISSRQEIALDR